MGTMGSKNIYERFIWFDDRVRAKKFPNATRLAAQFEISAKTAQRDIEFMRDRLNCPLLYDTARKGYHYEDETFSLPLIHLSSAELSALMLARTVLRDLSGSCLGGEISSAVEKITSIISSHTARPENIDDILSFHMIEYAPAPDQILRTVLEACLKKQSLAIRYASPAGGGETERTVDPYHIFNYMGTWHLVGYCHLRKSLRDFRISRIASPRVLEGTFSVRAGFSVAGYFRSSFGLYKGGPAKEVVIRFSPEKAKWLRGQIWHRDQEEKELEDGSLELSFPVADFSEIFREILKHGAGVEVIQPEVLRTMIRDEAAQIVKKYNAA